MVCISIFLSIIYSLVVFFFFFEREFQPMMYTFNDRYQTKTLISFSCVSGDWGLNPKSLIQPSEFLSVKLTKSHLFTCSLVHTNSL